MNNKGVIKIAITIIAILLSVVHIILPNISIDIITVILFAIAIIPWLEPLFKSVELPGGLKLEFQDLKKIEIEAKEAGLIQTNVDLEIQTELQTKFEYPFVEIAEKNQELALVSLRIEIEKRLRVIASKYSIETKKYSILQLIGTLSKDGILNLQETESLKDMIITLNQAAHGVEFDKRNAEWVIEYGPKIINSLNNKIEHRGGRISHANPDSQEHWIEKSFNDCEWETNYEFGECIKKHSELWELELKNIYSSLLKKLKEGQQVKLIETQKNWEKQIDLEREFIGSFDNIQFKIGREGMFITSINFMNKIKERVLELEEILARLT